MGSPICGTCTPSAAVAAAISALRASTTCPACAAAAAESACTVAVTSTLPGATTGVRVDGWTPKRRDEAAGEGGTVKGLDGASHGQDKLEDAAFTLPGRRGGGRARLAEGGEGEGAWGDGGSGGDKGGTDGGGPVGGSSGGGRAGVERLRARGAREAEAAGTGPGEETEGAGRAAGRVGLR